MPIANSPQVPQDWLANLSYCNAPVIPRLLSSQSIITLLWTCLKVPQTWLAYCYAAVIFHQMLSFDLSIGFWPLSSQTLIILLSYWNCELTKWPSDLSGILVCLSDFLHDLWFINRFRPLSLTTHWIASMLEMVIHLSDFQTWLNILSCSCDFPTSFRSFEFSSLDLYQECDLFLWKNPIIRVIFDMLHARCGTYWYMLSCCIRFTELPHPETSNLSS